ncbi:histidinol-phosphate transaminase [Candidatus Aminicenantes bacterium AC-335-B20]|jgi:histidinol-phosphate aminotransferase|nr:histidinol-phosphate transaminase [SCandidatus Aminicenantes bacterium Aminicenantia_JdfR_composite]MCP2597501.1 histidinol-phosphate transaminase [Candidatus Aminicenantes bacterium AC-335-G13]MCP2599228.1 histidinol-phosphate transaminase [Candidatus Aminicenantes bacterium AC-335-B20]MCP2618430.1 histidinol-phosphate transaminase [Candidatus Aminicenantes bacterium AC-335-A11]MCP2620737.1 histidinol-phosphate transaminase [Candidatus Aminicenantes bacterium AC-334-E05]
MKELIPFHISQIEPYVPGLPIEEIKRKYGLKKVVKLASNENPLGPSRLAVEAIRKSLDSINRYPIDDGYYLKKALSEKLDFPMEQIILGGGSTDLIKMIARAFLDRDDKAIISETSFLMYRLAICEVNGKEAIIKVPLKNYTYDLESFLNSLTPEVKLIFIANPNNPTGTMIRKKELDEFISKIPDNIIIVLDEAYKEYITDPDFPDGTNYIKKGKKVIVLRTFSKIYGLAGLRVGYGISSEEIIDGLKRTKTPFNLPRVSHDGALGALEDEEHVKKSLKLNTQQREFLSKELKKLGLEVIPSVTNFIMVKSPKPAKEFAFELMKKGVIVRPLDAFEAPEHIRITVGTEEDNLFLLEKLKEIL